MNTFEYKGHKIEIDYGITVDKDASSYEGILKILNPTIDWYYGDNNDYQGDWFAIGLGKDNKWYYHKGSYGSCSGCDWLQGISDEKGAIEFLKEMEKIMPAGNTKEEAIDYLTKEKQNLWDTAQAVVDKLIQYVQKHQGDKK